MATRKQTAKAGTSTKKRTSPAPADQGTPPAPAGETLDDVRRDVQGSDTSGDPGGSTERKGPGRPRSSDSTKARQRDYQREYRRRQKAKAQAGGMDGSVELPDAQAMRSLARSLCEAVAVRRGPHWKLSEAEAVALGDAAHAVASKYAPMLGAEVALVIAAVSIFGPRLYIDFELARQARAKRAAELAAEVNDGFADNRSTVPGAGTSSSGVGGARPARADDGRSPV